MRWKIVLLLALCSVVSVGFAKGKRGPSRLPDTTNTLTLIERAGSPDISAGTGMIWVKNDAPTTLYFQDDEQNDFQISGPAITLTVTDNDVTNETNAILFTSGGVAAGDLAIESDTDLTYNPSTGALAATSFTTGSSATPELSFNVTAAEAADWDLRVDNVGNSFEIASSSGAVGDNVEVEIDESGNVFATGTVSAVVGFDCTGDVDCDYGSADIDDHTFVTDGTGDAEFVVPSFSIDADENTYAIMEVIEFCGQGQTNADGYFAPATSRGQVLVLGDATCNAMDDAAVGDSDDVPWTTFPFAYTVNGMECQMSAGGTDTVVTMKLMDDTVATAIDCNWTNDGGAKTCSHDRAEQVSVAANSLMAIMIDVTDADEDLSAVNFKCDVFISH